MFQYQSYSANTNNNPTKSRRIFSVVIFSLMAFFVGYGICKYVDKVEAEKNFPYPVMSFPRSGYIFENFREADECAPLEIETPYSDDGERTGYYFVVKPTIGNGRELRFFVHEDDIVEVSVPLGRYEIYYASGEKWYGEEHLFGTGTQYYKLDDKFEFYFSDYEYIGWTIRLEATSGGNLDQDEISANDFPS